MHHGAAGTAFGPRGVGYLAPNGSRRGPGSGRVGEDGGSPIRERRATRHPPEARGAGVHLHRTSEEFEAFDSEAQAKSHVVRAIETVAETLGNTPAVSRKCYVHPAIIESYMDGSLLKALRRRAEQELADSLRELRPEEAAILALLQQRLTRETEDRSGSGRAA